MTSLENTPELEKALAEAEHFLREPLWTADQIAPSGSADVRTSITGGAAHGHLLQLVAALKASQSLTAGQPKLPTQ